MMDSSVTIDPAALTVDVPWPFTLGGVQCFAIKRTNGDVEFYYRSVTPTEPGGQG